MDLPDGVRHRHGGRITAVTGIGHETYQGVASWHFIGNVAWDGGGTSTDLAMAPIAVCETGEESLAVVNALMGKLSAYLDAAGTWNKEPKHHRNGRVSFWTPREPEGREVL